MAVLFSKNFNISEEIMSELGVFDAFLDEDSPFFINIKLLQQCTIPEFKASYDRINDYFRGIGLLLKKASPHDKLYRTAYSKFNFPEVNGINLGFSDGEHGAGFGVKLRKQIIKDAHEIIKNGCEQPELFHMLSLFEDNVGPDRLSDMIAQIIAPDIIKYTKRVLLELGITPENYPSYHFKNGLIVNPYKRYYILLLPESILHELPIARCWDDIDRVCSENEAIRAELNEVISEEWKKLSVSQKKEYLRDYVFKNPNKANEVLAAYKAFQTNGYSVYQNPQYLAGYLTNTYNMEDSKSETSYLAALDIIEHFKKWVEYHRGSNLINDYKLPEKAVQILIHAVAHMYCEKFNWDFSPETDSGRGPVDFKVSRGTDKTVIEVKLTSNRDCVHGLEIQIEEYARAENTQCKVFVLVKNDDHSNRVTAVEQTRNAMENNGLSPATVVVIDAIPKASASKYKP